MMEKRGGGVARKPGDALPTARHPYNSMGDVNCGGIPGRGCEVERSVRPRAALASRLREVREDLWGEGGAQILADAVGVPLRTWQNYEDGVTMTAEVLLRFIEVTGVSPRWLLSGEGPTFTGRGG